jgi:hypothetical protein
LKLGRISDASNMAIESGDAEILSFLVLSFRFKIEANLANIRKLKDKADRMTRSWYIDEIRKYLVVLCLHKQPQQLFESLCLEMNPAIIPELHRMFENEEIDIDDSDGFVAVRTFLENMMAKQALVQSILAPTADKSLVQLRDAKKFIRSADPNLLSSIASQIVPDNEMLETPDIIVSYLFENT